MPARRLVTAALGMATLAGSLALAPAASADGLPPMHLSTTTLSPNQSFTLSGTGCLSPDIDYVSTGRVWVVGPISAQSDADSAGHWSMTVTENATFNGTYQIQATCSYQTATSTSVQKSYPPATITVVGGQTPWPTSFPKHPDVPSPAPSRPGQGAASTTRTHAATPARTPAAPAPTSTQPTPMPAGPLPPTPAAGCIACARIASGAPLGAGWPVMLRYTGFQPNERVTLDMHSTPVRLGSFTADGSGMVSASVRIPRTAASGAHTLTFTGSSTGIRVVAFTLIGATPPSSMAGRVAGTVAVRPPSRAALWPPVAVGAVLLAVAAAGTVLGVRRRVRRRAPGAVAVDASAD